MNWIPASERLPDRRVDAAGVVYSPWVLIWTRHGNWAEARLDPPDEFNREAAWQPLIGDHIPLKSVTHWAEVEGPEVTLDNA